MTIESGSIIKGVYRVEKLVYADPNRRVYWALQQRLRLAVDLNVEGLTSDAETSPRASRSIELMQRIRHPNVVALLDHWVDRDAGEAVYVSEFVGGETLAHHRARRGVLPWQEVALVMDGVLRALEAMHESEVVHRNVRPGAIMLCATGPPVVRLSGMRLLKSLASDRNLGRVTRRGSSLPETPYNAPEVLLGHEAGPAADLYALSVVAYQLLSGYLPGTPTGRSTLSQRVSEPPPPPQTPSGMPPLSPAFMALIMGGLAVDPSERPESALAYRQSIAAFTDKSFPADAVAASQRADRVSGTRLRVHSSTGAKKMLGFRGRALVAAICPAHRVLEGDGAMMEKLAGPDSVAFDLGIRFSLALVGTDPASPLSVSQVADRVTHIQRGLNEAFGKQVPFVAQDVDGAFVLPRGFLSGDQAPPQLVLELLDRLAQMYPVEAE